MTTPIFENKSEITLEKYLYLSNHPIGKKAKKKLKNWIMLQIFAMAVMAVNAFVCFYADALPIAVISLVLVAAFLYKLMFQRNRASTKQYKQIIENQENGMWYRVITFDKDIKVTDGNTVTTFKYHEFVKFDEDERYYLLFKNENAVLRVEKGAFTVGNDEDFVVFINKKVRPKKK
ncbi:MAG: YcxB family protein [Oscillospiraceae bacterium]|nr:YcxB family protein [Oscillospiraceae bacterium]